MEGTHTIKELKDEEILALSMSNPDLFVHLVQRYESAFMRKAISILKNQEDAEDVVQETFVKIYTAGKRFKKVAGATFSSWGYKILVRQCFTLYQKKKRRGSQSLELTDEMLDVIPDFKVEDMREGLMVREELLVASSKLPLLFKEAINKFFFEEKSHKEISAEVGISEEVSRTRLHRAKILLKKILIQNN